MATTRSRTRNQEVTRSRNGGEETVRTRARRDEISRERLIELLNEDLQREYQAVIAYVVYSQVLKGAQYMTIAEELERHAGEELAHAITISKHIDYLGGMPAVTPKLVKTSERAEDIREILVQEQEHQIDLATALGKDVVDVAAPKELV